MGALFTEAVFVASHREFDSAKRKHRAIKCQSLELPSFATHVAAVLISEGPHHRLHVGYAVAKMLGCEAQACHLDDD